MYIDVFGQVVRIPDGARLSPPGRERDRPTARPRPSRADGPIMIRVTQPGSATDSVFKVQL